ncbi:MAG: MFS transporter, partial [Dehalococcoidales bacterium]
MALLYGTRHSFSVFFPPILGEFGWSRGSTALMLSLNILVYGLVAPIAGTLGDRWKPRRIMPIGITIVGLATAGCAFATELWHFYLLFGILMPVGTAFSGWPLIGPALTNWFSKRRGLVLGLGQLGGGISFTYGMFVEFVISQLGWRYAYFVIA